MVIGLICNFTGKQTFVSFQVVLVARKKAQDFEKSADRLKAFRTLHRLSLCPDLIKNLRNAQQMIQA